MKIILWILLLAVSFNLKAMTLFCGDCQKIVEASAYGYCSSCGKNLIPEETSETEIKACTNRFSQLHCSDGACGYSPYKPELDMPMLDCAEPYTEFRVSPEPTASDAEIARLMQQELDAERIISKSEVKSSLATSAEDPEYKTNPFRYEQNAPSFSPASFGDDKIALSLQDWLPPHEQISREDSRSSVRLVQIKKKLHTQIIAGETAAQDLIRDFGFRFISVQDGLLNPGNTTELSEWIAQQSKSRALDILLVYSQVTGVDSADKYHFLMMHIEKDTAFLVTHNENKPPFLKFNYTAPIISLLIEHYFQLTSTPYLWAFHQNSQYDKRTGTAPNPEQGNKTSKKRRKRGKKRINFETNLI